MSKQETTAGEWWEIRRSCIFPGEWCYRRRPGRGFWLFARFAHVH